MAALALLLQNTEVQVKKSRLPSAAEILSQGYTGCDLNSCGFWPLVACFLKSLLIYLLQVLRLFQKGKISYSFSPFVFRNDSHEILCCIPKNRHSTETLPSTDCEIVHNYSAPSPCSQVSPMSKRKKERKQRE